MKSKIISILALLLMAVAQSAWAERHESFTTNTSLTYSGDYITITGTEYDGDGLRITNGNKITIASKNGEIITKVLLTFSESYGKANAGKTTSTKGTVNCTDGNASGSITGINATSLEIGSTWTSSSVQIKQIDVYYATESFTTKSSTSFSGDYITITGTSSDSDGLRISRGNKITIASKNGEIITKVLLTFSSSWGAANAGTTTSTAGTVNCTNGNASGSITGINASSIEISSTLTNPSDASVQIEQIEVFFSNTFSVTANSASEAYWATFYSNAGNYQAAEGTQVFTVSLAGTGITMNEVSDRIAKSGEGVVLKKTTTGNFTMTLTETAPAGDFSDNSLTGTMTVINTTGANDYYVLGGKSGAGFYKLSNTSGTIGANKAYLTYSGGGAAAARGFFLFEETTGIEMPTAEDNDNADAVVYDLQGRRVQNPTKGLYIVNGKKVFINK